MQFEQVIFLVNSLSRSGRRTAEAIDSYMKEKPISYRIIQSEGEAFDLQAYSKQMPADSLYVISGGDGSLNHYVSYLEEKALNLPLAYLATGAGNDFARSLNLPINDVPAGLDYIFNLTQPKTLNIIKANDGQTNHYAVNSLGFGIDGWTNKLISDAPKTLKKMLGSSIYAMAIIPAYIEMTPRPLELVIEDKIYHFEKSLLALAVNNPYFGGGLKIDPKASALSDDLNCIVLDGVTVRDIPVILQKLLTDQTHLSHPKFHTFSAKSFTLNLLKAEYGEKDGEMMDKASYSIKIETVKRLFWV